MVDVLEPAEGAGRYVYLALLHIPSSVALSTHRMKTARDGNTVKVDITHLAGSRGITQSYTRVHPWHAERIAQLKNAKQIPLISGVEPESPGQGPEKSLEDEGAPHQGHPLGIHTRGQGDGIDQTIVLDAEIQPSFV